jgi:ATP-dependent exoDNAse (exonuclease V) beta subunit
VLFGWPEPGLPVLAAERADVEAAERVRLLYVASTRAKRRLVVGARSVKPKDWRRARSFAELLAERHADWERTAAAGAAGEVSEGVRFVVADAPEVARGRHPHTPFALPDPAEVARDDERLRTLRAEAARRAERPFRTTASAEAHAKETRAEALAGEGGPRRAPAGEGGELSLALAGAERSVALAAGTAVHALLEAGLLEGDADTALERAAALAAAPGERDAVLAHARSLWQRFRAGPLAPRLAALAPHVVARELPVWVEPAGDGDADPVGFVAGAIDLLYRDPATGELVVADYKTDAVDAAGLDTYAARYAPQGRHYARAVERALGLARPPRFELWFLAAGEVRTLAP